LATLVPLVEDKIEDNDDDVEADEVQR